MQNKKVELRIAGAEKIRTKKGSKYPVTLYTNGVIVCGCVALKHSILLKRFRTFGVQDDFTEDQLHEYEKIFKSMQRSYFKYLEKQNG